MLLWFVQNTVVVGVGVIVLSLVCRGQRLSPATRHALWLIVLVKMLTPPWIAWPWSIPLVGEHRLIEFAATRDIMSQPPSNARIEYVESYVDLSRVELAPSVGHDAGLSIVQAPRSDAENALSIDWTLSNLSPNQWFKVAGFVWLAGGVATLLLILTQTVRLLHWIARANKSPVHLVAEVQRLAAMLSLRTPRVVLSPQVATPLVWGIARPTILWPSRLSSMPSAGNWEGIIVHELAHLKRGDHWVGILEILAAAIWWWNPLFWYVRHQLRENAELACDSWVIATLPQGRRAYAEAILEICQNVTKSVAPMPACGVGRGPRRSLERRLTMIFRERVHFRIPRAGLFAIALLAIVSLPSWSQTQVTPPTPATDTAVPFKASGVGPAAERNAEIHLAQDPNPAFNFVNPDGVLVPFFTNMAMVNPDPSGVTKATPTADQLHNLEQQLVQLLEQVRSFQPANQVPPLGIITPPTINNLSVTTGQPLVNFSPVELARINTNNLIYGLTGQQPPPQGIEVVEAVEVRVFRTTYRLPAEKAQALEQFVKQNFVSEVETRFDGNTLVVLTHSAQDEDTMRRFIYLMLGTPLPKPTAPLPEALGAPAPTGKVPTDPPIVPGAPPTIRDKVNQ